MMAVLKVSSWGPAPRIHRCAASGDQETTNVAQEVVKLEPSPSPVLSPPETSWLPSPSPRRPRAGAPEKMLEGGAGARAGARRPDLHTGRNVKWGRRDAGKPFGSSEN